MTENKWVQLENGELLLFLHQHLPSLQAKTHHEFNGLGRFLRLLDYLITNKFESSDTPMLEMRISQKEFKRFGSGKYYQQYIDIFFIPDPDYFYYGDAYIKPRKYRTYIFIQSFIQKAQNLIRAKIGDDKYFKPLKINLNNPKKIKAYSIPFSSSKILNNNLFVLFKNYATSGDWNKEFVDKLGSADVLLTNKQDLDYYNHTLNKRQIRTLPEDKEICSFEVKRLNKSQEYKVKIPTFKQLKANHHTKIKINLIVLDKMIDEAKGFEINKLLTIKRHYKDNDNYLFYAEANHRLFATANLNTAPLLQGFKKEIRNKLFSGFYQYDLTASAPTILYQLYQKHCKTTELKAVESYITDRDSLRVLCANYLLASDKKHYKDLKRALTHVKELITSIFYGGKVLNKRSDVNMSHTNRKALVKNIKEFKALADEANYLFDKLYKEIAKSTNSDGEILYEKIVINPHKKRLNRNGKPIKRSKGSVLSEIYFYHERQILDIARESYPDIILLIHDAIILDDEIMYDELERIIKQELGLIVHYEEELLD